MVLLDLPSRPRGAVCPPLDPPAYEGINAELCEYDKMSADELEQRIKAAFFSED